MDNSTRLALLDVVEDALVEIDELENSLILTLKEGDNIEEVRAGFRRMVMERLNQLNDKKGD